MPVQRKQAGKQIVRELVLRLDLIMGIGLDYLSLTRPAGTLSGGEAQRIRLSTQIGSGLMGDALRTRRAFPLACIPKTTSR